MPIETREQLHAHIIEAIGIELTVFPAYLYAMYSLADRASDSAKVLKSVAAEEMLHAILGANLLLATGGDFTFCSPYSSFPIDFTHRLPHLTINLEPFSQDVVERVFLPIEEPGDDSAPKNPDQWDSQGQFYGAIWEAIVRLNESEDLFDNPQVDRQFDDPHGYLVPKFDAGDTGGLVIITDLESAGRALETIIHQGEGVSHDRYADDSHAELTHYAKFLHFPYDEISRSGVLPAMVNPTVATLPPHIRPVAEFSDAVVTYLYLVMDRILGPKTEEHHHQVGLLYGGMVALLAPVARYLMTLEIGNGTVAGPPFGYYAFDVGSAPETQLRRMGHELVQDHPALQVVVDLLHRLPDDE